MGKAQAPNRTYGNLDIILDHFSCSSQRYHPHTRRVLCSTMCACWLGAEPCWLGADLCLQSVPVVMPDSPLQVWSLGATVWEMAAAAPPLAHLEAMAALFHIGNCNDIGEPPESLGPDGIAFVKLCTSLSGSISTVLTGLSWICVGIHSRRPLPCPVCALNGPIWC